MWSKYYISILSILLIVSLLFNISYYRSRFAGNEVAHTTEYNALSELPVAVQLFGKHDSKSYYDACLYVNDVASSLNANAGLIADKHISRSGIGEISKALFQASIHLAEVGSASGKNNKDLQFIESVSSVLRNECGVAGTNEFTIALSDITDNVLTKYPH